MIVFYSGYGCKDSDPELYFGRDQATIMLTYYDSHKKDRPERRFRRYNRARKKGQSCSSSTQVPAAC